MCWIWPDISIMSRYHQICWIWPCFFCYPNSSKGKCWEFWGKSSDFWFFCHQILQSTVNNVRHGRSSKFTQIDIWMLFIFLHQTKTKILKGCRGLSPLLLAVPYSIRPEIGYEYINLTLYVDLFIILVILFNFKLYPWEIIKQTYLIFYVDNSNK